MSDCRYSEYDDFAWVYNKHLGERFLPMALTVLEKLALYHIPSNAAILDLCCGTGQLAGALTSRGYQVSGIDGSEEMLRFARENTRGARFILEDARTFVLPETYDLVASMSDSLNHIMTTRELKNVFHNVYAALLVGGLFVFDLNMKEAYKAHWDGLYSIIEDDHVCIIRESYSPQDLVARFEATIFRLESYWQRSDIVLLQKPYTEVEVRSALEDVGFTDILAYTYDRKSGFVELTEESQRAFFLCRKP